MFQNLEIFRMAYSMASHAGQRQAVTARNLANADTPGYRAQDITPFKETLRGQQNSGIQKASRTRHMHGARPDQSGFMAPDTIVDESAKMDPNGNSVAVESEILRSVDAKRQHDRALAIYSSSLKIIRTSLGRNR